MDAPRPELRAAGATWTFDLGVDNALDPLGCRPLPRRRDDPPRGLPEQARPRPRARRGHPPPDRIAAAKATLVAQGVPVGQVDAANDSYARVTGLDAKVVTPADDISFIDVATGRVVNIGRLHGTTDQGALLIKAGSFGERAPRIGDLAAKLK